jgi:hypothetical protein
MSARHLALDVLLVAAVAGSSLVIARELRPPPPVPPLIAAAKRPAPGAAGTPAAGKAGSTAAGGAIAPGGVPPRYSAVVSKNLFSPTRTDVPPSAVAAAPTAPRPFLLGVVVDDGRSRAYLQDPTSRKVFGYGLGDTVGGGRLESIREDRVVIARPEGTIEVMLRDPSKPRPPAPAPPAAPRPAEQPGAAPPAAAAPGARPVQPEVPAQTFPQLTPQIAPIPAPGVAPDAGPRAPQPLPPDFLRRRSPLSPPAAPAPNNG